MKWISDYRQNELAHTGSMNPIRLGNSLKVLMRARGLTLKKVSAETGIPYSTLHTWLENRQPKDILKVKLLADYLEVGLHFLLFGEEDKRPGRAVFELPHRGQADLAGVYEVIVRRRNDK